MTIDKKDRDTIEHMLEKVPDGLNEGVRRSTNWTDAKFQAKLRDAKTETYKYLTVDGQTYGEFGVCDISEYIDDQTRNCWTVTHLATGTKVGMCFYREARARELAEVMAGKFPDTADLDEYLDGVEQAGRAYSEAMESLEER